MRCDDVELSIIEAQPLAEDAAAHVAGCARCRAFEEDTRRLLADAALPEPSAEERAALVSLPSSTLAAWRKQERRRGLVRQLVGYAVAAGLGALLASAVLLKTRPAQHHLVEAPVLPVAAEVASSDVAPVDLLGDDDLHLSDDEVFFDVTWPSNPEGENL